MKTVGRVCAVLAASAVAACSVPGMAPREDLPATSRLRTSELAPPPLTGAALQQQPVAYEALPGWAGADYAAALEAFTSSCSRYTPEDPRKDALLSIPHLRWAQVCREAEALWSSAPDQAAARTFFETAFEPSMLSTNDSTSGVVTAYYEPIIEARAVQIGPFDEPILARPGDLVIQEGVGGRPDQVMQRLPAGQMRPYPDRAEIIAGAGSNILAWGRRSDVLFLQIQGSGRLQFPDGRIVRAAFDATNGRPYVSVARELMQLGLLPPGQASNAGVKRWLDVAGPDAAAAVVARNPRYVFFRLEEIGSPEETAVGAAGVRLQPRASIAVDPAHHQFGGLYWIAPQGPQAPEPQFGVAHDVGGAIKGPLRADLFFGVGEDVGQRAARVNHQAQWYVLTPRIVEAARRG